MKGTYEWVNVKVGWLSSKAILIEGEALHFCCLVLCASHLSRSCCKSIISLTTFTFTFSHLADAFIQSDVQSRKQSSYKQ